MCKSICQKITSGFVYTSLAICVFFLCIAPATYHSRKRPYKARLSACGSRQIDTLRFMCQLKMWETQNCVVAKRALCRRNTYSRNPICRFQCRDSTSSGQSSLNKTSINRQERGISQADVQSLFQNLFSRNVRSISPTTAENRRRRRLSARRCCRRSCSRTVLSEFCNTT